MTRIIKNLVKGKWVKTKNYISIPNVITGKELFDFDEEGYPNEEGDYHDSKLCLLTDIDGYEKHDGLLWYIKNECKDIEIKESDIEDYIGDISSSIPGNIHFIR